MREQLESLLKESLSRLAAGEGWSGLDDVRADVERTRDPRHGDFTSNLAMRAAKGCGTTPRTLATRLVEALPDSALVERAEVAGPGFINFRVSDEAFREQLPVIAARGEAYGTSRAAAGTRVLVEYVSANPTGPLHVGHGRGAAYGASLASILRATGHDVDEEYYVNDAGRQMDILATSVWFRYAQTLGASIELPPNAYQGDYVRGIAAALAERHGDALLGDAQAVLAAAAAAGDDGEARLDALIGALKRSVGDGGFATLLGAALDSVLDDIRDDLAGFGVVPGRWYSERSLTESGAVEHALELLRGRGLLYEQDGATWFRSSEFGDDKDRVVVRENGATTYFASDIAYHLEKCERGYDLLLNVLGADHHGYVARMRAALEAIGQPAGRLEVQVFQFVVLYRGKVKAQMSTRSGEYVTLRDLRNEVGNDAARLFYVSRSNDQHLEFDLELAKSQSSDNPVYYIQYAHARVSSMVKRIEDGGGSVPDPGAAALDALDTPEDRALVAALTRYPEVVQLAADNRAPQHVVHYLRDLAADFHAYYNTHKVLTDDARVRDARLVLALGVRQVVGNGLGLLGVAAPDAM